MNFVLVGDQFYIKSATGISDKECASRKLDAISDSYIGRFRM